MQEKDAIVSKTKIYKPASLTNKRPNEMRIIKINDLKKSYIKKLIQ